MESSPNAFLIAAATLNALAAALHVACIVFGAAWYRFFGAGERMARLVEQGSREPAIVTSIIAAVLATWSLYALSGAGLIPRLPLVKAALCIITAIYLLRGAVVFPMAVMYPGRITAFWWWSSGICLAIGIVHAIGLEQVWSML